MARTDTLGHFLTDVADAIRTKTGSVNTIAASNFDTEIENIPSGADLSDYFVSEISSFTPNAYKGGLQVIKKTPSINIADTVTTLKTACYDYWKVLVNPPTLVGGKNVTDMENLFGIANSGVGGYVQYSTADVSQLDTRSCMTMKYMFANNTRLTEITGIANLNCDNVQTAEGMFWACHYLTSIDFGNNTFPLLTTTKNMFYGCTRLSHLDIRGMSLTSLSSFDLMFGDTSVDGAMPVDCEIIVADQSQKDWINTNFSRFTNVKTVAEHEAE